MYIDCHKHTHTHIHTYICILIQPTRAEECKGGRLVEVMLSWGAVHQSRTMTAFSLFRRPWYLEAILPPSVSYWSDHVSNHDCKWPQTSTDPTNTPAKPHRHIFHLLEITYKLWFSTSHTAGACYLSTKRFSPVNVFYVYLSSLVLITL